MRETFLLPHPLFDMHTPPWLLNILISYLSNRSMVMSHMTYTSKPRALPGGGPQGALLGGIIFIVKFNGAFLRPPIPPLIKVKLVGVVISRDLKWGPNTEYITKKAMRRIWTKVGSRGGKKRS